MSLETGPDILQKTWHATILPIASNITANDRGHFLDLISNRLFAILKIIVFGLMILALILILIKVYTPQGIVIMPFEISRNENISGSSVADQLTAELMYIQKIHNTQYEDIITKTKSSYFASDLSSERSLGNQEMLVPKAATVEFSMAEIGNIGIGQNSLSLGNIIIAFKSICPGSKPVNTIRGSLQRYGSTITLVAVMEGNNFKSWILRKKVENNNESHISH